MKHIVDVKNGDRVNLAQLGITGTVGQVWTVIDEDKLYTQFNPYTGTPHRVDLQNVKPVHQHSAFIEDGIHDYTVLDGVLHLHSHTTEAGTMVQLLVITFEPLQPVGRPGFTNVSKRSR